MKLKRKHIRHHHFKAVNGKKQLYLLAAAIIALAIGVGALTYFKGSPSQTANNLPVHFTDNFGDTFDNKPISAFPPELVLPGVTVQQYFDNATYSGILYKSNANYAQIKANYQTALAGTPWSVMALSSSPSSTAQANVFTLANKETKLTATVTMHVAANNTTMVVVAAQK